MATISRTRATLRITGDNLLPEEVSGHLDCLPSLGQERGQEIKTPSGRSRIAGFGMWRLFATVQEPGNLDFQVSEILNQLTDDLSVWRKLANNFHIDLFCGIFMERDMEGISLSPESLLKLGERKILLDLDIYGPDEEDENV